MNKNCVNISSKEFKDLVKKYNISAANMEDVIHEYLLLNNTDEFPPDSYIELKFSGVRTKMSEYQLILWENRYSQPQVFDNINDFNKAKLEALRYFKPQAIVEYTDALGNYIFKVAYPDFEKEYQEILANAPRNSEGKLLAPNGKPSNLTERQYALVRSKAFKRWFGDWENNPKESSKIVDENGEPLVVYHTVNGDVVLQGKADFTIFDPNAESDKKHNSSLLYFTDNKLMSESYFNDNRVWRSIDEVKEELNKYINLKNKLIPNLKLSSHQLIENFAKKFGLTAEECIKDLGYNTIEEFLNLNYRLYTIRGILEQINELLQRIDFLTTIIENPNKLVKTRAFFINERTPFIVDAKGHNWNELTTKGYDVEAIIKEINDAKSYRNGLINLAINKYISNEIANIISIEELEEQLPEEVLNEVELKVNAKYPNINNLESTRSIENLIIDNPDYDGTLIKDVMDWGSISWKYNWNEVKKTGTVIAVKNPNQIKSAESNIGTFSRTNDRIDRFEGQEGNRLTVLSSLPIKLDNSIIEEFYNNLDKNNPYHQVFKLVVDIIRANNMSINIKMDFNRQDIAMARLNGLKSVDITFNPERLLKYLMTFNKSLGRDLIMRILTHELIHSITASILETSPSWSKIRGFDEALTRFNKEINDLYNQALELLNDEGYYGMNNPKEFISEALTNPNFQLRLALIKSKNTNKNIFQRIIDSIVNLFNNLFKKQGVDINNTLLEDVLKVSLDYFNYAKEGMNKDIDNFGMTEDFFGEDTKLGQEGEILISTEGYRKGDPLKHPDVNYIFTENAEAYIEYTRLPLDKIPNFPYQGKPKLNVSDVNGTNLAGIRTDSKGNISTNVYGIVVKKYQQDANGRFVAKEGQFLDTADDYKLFIQLNEDVFRRLSKSSNKKIIFPSLIALGKSALPLRFVNWLLNQLSERFGISSTIEKNTRADYDGYGLKINSVQQQSGQEEDKEINPLTITNKTLAYGVAIDNNLIRNYRTWLLNNPNGIVAYRVNKLKFNTPLMVELGIIGNPFNWQQYGTEKCLKMFYDWLVNGNNYNEPLATEEFRLAIIDKILSTLTPNILYYKELNMPSHATILGYLITNKQILTKPQPTQLTLQQLKEEEKVNKNVTKIISGGQTGVDTIGLQVAKELGIETGGTAPKNFLRELGIDLEDISSYGLIEITDEQQAKYTEKTGKRDSYTARTELNVRNSDGTVYFYTSDDKMGMIATQRSAKEFNKPFLINPTAEELRLWIEGNNIQVLNVAGNRGSKLAKDNKVAKILREALMLKPKSIETIVERDPYEKRQQETARQLEALLNSNLMTNTEIREIADLMVYWISDHITELLEKPQLAEQIYGERLKSLDTLNMERIDIVKAIGLDNILELCKLKFSPLNIGTTKISLLKKAKLITDNWLAVMQLANSTFAEIEKFSVEEKVVGDKVIKTTNADFNENLDNFDNNQQNDEDFINEVLGNLLEHWQTKANTISVMDSMSLMMRRAISHCYQLKEVDRDEDNKPIYDKIKSEFGINLRVKPREVTSQLLSWCKGALNINDVIQQLKEKETNNPWVSLIISRLEDLTGNETEFLSQFFGVFVKPFMTYSIIKKDAKTGQYISLIVNKNPALKEAVKSIVTLYKIGQNPMFLASGHINELTFKLFEQAKKELDNANFELNFDTIVKDLGYMYNALGYTVTSDIIKEILIDKLTFKTLYTQFNYIYASLAEYVDKEDISDYQPFKFKGEGNILGSLNKVLKPITDTLEDTMETSFYDSGNMYQSYVLPSYMTKLMNKFHLKGELFIKFINDEYAKYEWFKDKSARSIERGWKNEMLRELVNSEEARKIFDHKVLLNFNKHQYMRNMDDTECALAILSEYWSETSRAKSNITRVPAWFRVPMLSNKPSAEYIKFYSERGDNYKEVLTENLYKIFLLELGRILTVEMRGYNKSDPEFIKNFDKNGKKFNFLDFMNSYLTGTDKNSDLGKLIRKKLEGKKLSPELEIEFKNLVLEAIKASMNSKVESIMKNWREQGIVDAAKNIEGIDKNKIERELENFIWNDTYMSMNILELTITDKAYYKDEEDLQKRLALIHAPGIRGNEFATDYQGNRVSDGKLRTFYLKDFDNFISNITDNVDIVFNRRIKEAKEQDKSELEIKGLEALKDSLTRKPKTLGDEDKGGLFYQVDVANALGYSSPTSYRKKAFLFGKWSKLAEDIYLKLITGNYTYSDLKTAFLPLKPFVYTLIEKSTNLSSNEGMTNIKVPILNKNSEYLLILADAILLGENTGKPNLLRAIYNIMEESATTTKEIILNNGKKQTIRTPRVDGIDTVLFESAVKSGLRGAIDINQFYNMENGEQEAKKYIESLIGKNGAYNETFVDAIPVEDYCLQLEVPAHFKDHELAHGSLIRAITPSDLLETYPDGSPVKYKVEGRELEANEFIKEYEDTIALNVEESINLLRNELKLTPNATRLDRNKALEKILRREILSSPRYGVDLLLACTLKNGEFTIPKGDPIQSKRVEQLLNSIIKNRINKLEIAGGPVVLVSNFGTSKELNIRFKDKNGNLLMTKEEYEKSQDKSINTKTSSSQSAKFAAKYSKIKPKTYKEYLEENQAGIAYFEVFAPIYLNDIFEKFQNPDGSVDIKAIEELNPDLLKMIGYRIPTEDKYSCAPLKIVGFLPREAGDAIMLPNDITLLTGSDFKQNWSL